MSIEVPEFEPPFDESESTVRDRMMSDANPTLDVREGGITQSLVEGMNKEVARVYGALNATLMMAFPMWAFGIYLDYIAAEYGVTRKPATRAEGTVTFTGAEGVYIPLGTRVAVPASSTLEESIYFTTTADATIPVGLEIDVEVLAEAEGADSNVAAASITVVDDSILDLSSVTNADEMLGGADIEEDEDLRQRVLLEITSPQAAGSVSDHQRWMLSVDGVTAVTVVPLWDGPNTVKNVLLGTGNNPVSQSVLDAAQRLLTGDIVLTDPDSAITPAVGGAGTLTGTFYYKTTFVDDSGGETKGSPASASVSPTADEVDLTGIQIGPAGTVARRVYRSTTVGGTYYMVTEIADNATTAYTDDTASISGNRVMPKVNNTTGYLGQAPIGQRVTVDTPALTLIDISATVEFDSGYSLDGAGGTVALEELIVAALEDYISSRAPGDDVVYNHVLSTFFDVAGVYDVSALLVDGAAVDVALDPDQVSSLGTVTLS